MDRLKLKAVLAGRELAQWKLAQKLRINPVTFTAYVRRTRTPPEDFQARVEKALELEPGALSAD